MFSRSYTSALRNPSSIASIYACCTHTQPFHATAARMTLISQAIAHDHREVEQFYNEVVSSHSEDHQARYGNQFVWELARHSIGEELVVYPAFEKYMGAKGKKMADKGREQHHELKELLKVFQNMKPSDPDYVPKIKEIWGPLKQHIMEEEEDSDFPTLEKALKEASNADGEDVSSTNATAFGRTKMFVPSRSHPSAGENPPFETVMGLLTAPIDHLGDLFRKFPDQKISPNPSQK